MFNDTYEEMTVISVFLFNWTLVLANNYVYIHKANDSANYHRKDNFLFQLCYC
jgi:hypothetical protein